MNAHIMSSTTNTDKEAKLVQNSKDNKENLAEIPKASNEKESCAGTPSTNSTASTSASNLVTAGNGAGVGANTN